MTGTIDHPQLSVLIPAFNEEALILRAIESIHRSFAALSWRSYEIVVCDNHSNDRTADIAAACGARVVTEPENQIARARNTAARNASGEWLIFLDADSCLNPATLGETIRLLGSGGVCGGGAPLAFDGEIGRVAKMISAAWNWSAPKLRIAAGGYMFCLLEAWRDTGGFDETVFVGEDVRFSRKVGRWGRLRGMKFRIVTGPPILTSSRKIQMYGLWKVFLQFLALCLPGAMKSRRKAWQWYDR